MNGKQLFRKYDRLNEDNFYKYLKQLHYKSLKYLFQDKALTTLQITKSQALFREYKHTLIPVWLPTASPEFRVLEECWNIPKNDLLSSRNYTHLLNLQTKLVDILASSLDASEYRWPVMTLLFLKMVNDIFEENAEKLIKKSKRHTVL